MLPLKIQTKCQSLEVSDFDGIRYLMSGNGMFREQSAIDLADFHKHDFDYTLLAMYSLKFVPHPINILVIGLGGGVIPRELSYYCPNADVDIFEIDDVIADVAREHFFFKDDTNGIDTIHTHIAEGFTAIHNTDSSYDIIVLDAFLGQYIPFPFMSLEFAYASRKILKDKGVISINACNGHPFFEPHVKTLNEVYGDNVYSLDGQSNPYTTTIYACKENTKPSSGIYLPSNYYSDRCPVKINLTDGIKNSKILSLKNV